MRERKPPVPRAEWIASRAAAAAANAALDKIIDADRFDETENATASDRLLGALRQHHPEGGDRRAF